MANNTTSEQSSERSKEPLPRSRDFRFLRPLDFFLAEYTEKAAEFGVEHPEECLVNMRKFAEYVVIYVESATQVSNATDSEKGGNEEEERTDFFPRLARLEDYIPHQTRENLKYLWKRGNDAAHPPKVLLCEKKIRERKDQFRIMVHPILQAALEVAKWVRKDCANKQSGWTRIISLFSRRPIGLREQLEASITNRLPAKR
jgi:hypothetical protein